MRLGKLALLFFFFINVSILTFSVHGEEAESIEVKKINYTESFFREIENQNFEEALNLVVNYPESIDINMIRGMNAENAFFSLIKNKPTRESESAESVAWKILFTKVIEKFGKSIDYNIINKEKVILLHLMAKNLNEEELIQTYKNATRINFNISSINGRNVFHYLAIYNRYDVFNYLLTLDQLEGMDKWDNQGHNVLMYILDQQDDPTLAENLLSKYPKLASSQSKIDSSDFTPTPLHFAAKKGFNRLADMILKLNTTDINFKGKEGHGITPFMFAAKYANVLTLKTLLNHQASISELDQSKNNSLQLAIIGNRIENVIFLKDKFDINYQNENGNTALHLAIQGQNLEIVRNIFMTENILLNKKNVNDETAFMTALKSGNREIVLLFKDKKPDLNDVDKDGRSAFFYLLQNFEKEIIDYFISSHQGDFNFQGKDDEGNDMYHLLAFKGYQNILLEGLKKNPEAIHEVNDKGKSLFQLALLGGDKELSLKLLEDPKLNLEHKDSAGRSAVFEAIFLDDEDILKKIKDIAGEQILLKSDALSPLIFAAFSGSQNAVKLILSLPEIDINVAQEGSGNTPLYFAVAQLKYDIVELLLSALPAADPFLPNMEGLSPAEKAIQMGDVYLIEKFYKNNQEKLNEALFFAVYSKANVEVFELLISLGADVKSISQISERTGFDLLNYSADQGANNIFEYLIDNEEMDVNQKGPRGQTPLIRLVKQSNFELIEKLLSHSEIDVNLGLRNSKNQLVTNPLFLSFASENEEIVNLLVSREDINLHERDVLGDNALLLAVRYEYMDAAFEILERGGDFLAVNKYGDSPLKLALKFGEEELIKEMIKKGALLDQKLIKTAIKGEFGKDIDLMKQLVRFGADLDIIQSEIEHRNLDFDKKEFLEWAEIYYKECLESHGYGQPQLRDLASTNHPYSIVRKVCIDSELWDEIEEGNQYKPTMVKPTSGEPSSVNSPADHVDQ